jgi:hypothetical protein
MGLISRLKWKFNQRPKRIVPLSAVISNSDVSYKEHKTEIDFDEIKHPIHFEHQLLQNYSNVTIEKIKEHCLKSYVVSIKNGRFLCVYSRNMILYRDSVIEELSFHGYHEPNPKVVLTLDGYPKKQKINGKVLCLSVTGGQKNYFNFSTKLIQRIGFAKSMDYSISDFDFILVNKITASFQKELLDIHGIPSEKIIETEENTFIEATELMIPSLSLQSFYGNNYIRETVLNSPLRNGLSARKSPSRVFLSRRKAKWMRIVNEDVLDALFEKYNIIPIEFEGMSVLEQATLMNNCELFISVHGAGMTNIIYCKPKTGIIEILNRHRLNVGYYPYAVFQKLNYGYILADSVDNPDVKQNSEPYKNIFLDEEQISKIEKMIVTMLDNK